MKKLRFMLSFLALILAASFTMSCGASQQSQLQSITVNPANADAQSFPNGEVPFAATGHYIDPTHIVTPQPANWVACQKGLPTTDASVTPAGVAQCAAGAVGAYSINAWSISTGPGTYNCSAITACGGGCTIEGSAQLICP
ncbi:MAG: hypothetical protein WBZ01_20220 [Terriglobales bacterium]|jgi:hypothetical protein